MKEKDLEDIIAPHYVCIGGCGLVSDEQRKCNSQGCWRARNPLAECTCQDNEHTDFYKMYNPEVLEREIKN